MPVGDFPTVFPTIMKCWFYRMVTSENGIIHTYRYIYICAVKNICTFTYILDVSKRSVLGTADDDIAFFCIFCHCFWACTFLLIMNMLFGKYLQILHIDIYNTMLHVFCISWHCLLFMKRFVCNLRAYSAYLQYMEDTGRSKMRQDFWSFRGFRTK